MTQQCNWNKDIKNKILFMVNLVIIISYLCYSQFNQEIHLITAKLNNLLTFSNITETQTTFNNHFRKEYPDYVPVSEEEVSMKLLEGT